MNLFAGWEVIFQEFSLGIRGNECNSDFSPTILLKMPAIAEHSQRLVSRPAVTRQSAKKTGGWAVRFATSCSETQCECESRLEIRVAWTTPSLP